MTVAPVSLDDAVEVESVARGSRAERIGLIPGDVILRFGRHAPSEAIEAESVLKLLGRHEWLLVVREPVVFKLAVGAGLEGAEFIRARPLEGIDIPSEEADWPTFHGALQRGKGMIVLPDRTSVVWSLLPPIAFSRFRLWQLTAATALVYGLAAAMGPIPFLLAYATSVLTVAMGGASLLRDAAAKQGWLPTARLALAASGDAAKLEVATMERLKLEKAKALEAAAAAAKLAAEQ